MSEQAQPAGVLVYVVTGTNDEPDAVRLTKEETIAAVLAYAKEYVSDDDERTPDQADHFIATIEDEGEFAFVVAITVDGEEYPFIRRQVVILDTTWPLE